MKEIKLVNGKTVTVELTTNSPRSSYGIPVLRINGDDYGPKDWYGNLMAGDVAVLAELPGTRGFLKQAPDAARWWNMESVAE